MVCRGGVGGVAAGSADGVPGRSCGERVGGWSGWSRLGGGGSGGLLVCRAGVVRRGVGCGIARLASGAGFVFG